MLSDPAAERGVLAGIFLYGSNAYYDVADIINESTFTQHINSILYKCCRHILEQDDSNNIDIPSLYSAAQELNFRDILERPKEAAHIDGIINLPVNLKNVRKFAAKIRKLQISKLLSNKLFEASDTLKNIDGTESVTQILGIAEEAVFDFSSLINTEDGPKKLNHGLKERLEYLFENPVEQIGIPTGLPVFDKSIGGGIRGGTVNVIAARPKMGKTMLGENIGIYVSGELDIPVLYLDTEMLLEDQQNRGLAMLSGIPISEIETGQAGQIPDKKLRVLKAEKQLDRRYYHEVIAGKPFEEQLAMMRRWLLREVGLNNDGTAKQCVVIYDYIKLMNAAGISQSLQEYQLLGFVMTSLHNFAVKYNVPILAFCQLNRDGITKESTDTASGSDRIIWLCSNFSILKMKSDEEQAQDGMEHGTRKLVPIVSRHGVGLEPGDYINLNFDGKCAKITEGKTSSEIRYERNNIEANEPEQVVFDDPAEAPRFVR